MVYNIAGVDCVQSYTVMGLHVTQDARRLGRTVVLFLVSRDECLCIVQKVAKLLAALMASLPVLNLD